jgi:hypothetical protein
MSYVYEVIWIDEHGTVQYPGCDQEEATFAIEANARAAIISLRKTDPTTWDDADLRVRRVPDGLDALRQTAGSGQHSHEVPLRNGRVVGMRDGAHKGTDVYYSELGDCYVFVGHDCLRATARAERCLLIRGQDIDAFSADNTWACDSESLDGLCLVGVDFDDDLQWLSEGAEVLWDSASAQEG